MFSRIASESKGNSFHQNIKFLNVFKERKSVSRPSEERSVNFFKNKKARNFLFSRCYSLRTLCFPITQQKLHESMQNFVLQIIYHTRKWFFFLSCGKLICWRKQAKDISSPSKMFHSIASPPDYCVNVESWKCKRCLLACLLVKQSKRKLLMKINLFYQHFTLSDFFFSSLWFHPTHRTVQGTLNCFTNMPAFFFGKRSSLADKAEIYNLMKKNNRASLHE